MRKNHVRMLAVIMAIVLLLRALQELARKWCMEKRSAILPPPTINFGTIHGGMAGSVVADECVLDFGLHYLPADKDEKGMGGNVQADLFRALEYAIAGDEWLSQNRPEIELHQQGSGYEVSVDHEIVKLLEKNHAAALGKAPVTRGCEYGSDARLLNNYGETPTILYGPGSIRQAHGINEFVDIEQFFAAIEVLAGTIRDFCG